MATKYQDNRSVKVTTPFGPNALVFARMSHVERVSQPFHCEIGLLSESGDLDPDRILGKPLTVSLATTATAPLRYFHGLVTEFEQVGYTDRLHEYRAIARPWFWFLTRTADCRIFQNKSVPDIFREVCQQAGFADLDVRLGSYEPLEYCVQYRETDFNFLSRLLEREGIFYFFEHSENKHLLVLADDVGGCKAVTGYDSVPFYPPAAQEALRERDHLQSWSFQKSFQPGSFSSRDYNFEQPSPIPAGTSSISRPYETSKYEIYDFPAAAEALTSTGVERVAKLRVQELQVAQMVARGSGDAAGLAAGHVFKLTGHPRGSLDIQYLITSTSIDLSSNAYHAGSGAGQTRFAIAVEGADAREAYRPPRVTPKPVIHGTQTAVVVGPKGEEIYTDPFGRVKVQFHWDRYGKLDENSSCFMRVGQLWAGKSWGGIHIPRIGQEVIVSFTEGDPDRPLVIGSVYNGANKPPYSLPDNKTQSGIKSRSSLQGTVDNCNELRFEDKKGSELLFLHAEKDQTIEVENDESHSVGHDRSKSVKNNETTTIGKDRTESVTGNESITIDKDRTESVKGSETIDIGKDHSQTIGGGRTLSVAKDESITVSGGRTDDITKDEQVSIGQKRSQSIGTNDTLSVGNKLAIDAGDSIEIVTGSASITMKQDGTITVKGNNITFSGDGDITIKAGGNVVIKGTKVTQN
ncbi:MAG TPA: type VI secretion system tip protein TssI/VgrG [Steroidobacteraceae bacterium]|jgi:type VI secretion system secreted protein VgrG|nr:type VI secretion system tip protein TssI/VgrG [Steroidobacteraceae bacterium]